MIMSVSDALKNKFSKLFPGLFLEIKIYLIIQIIQENSRVALDLTLLQQILDLLQPNGFVGENPVVQARIRF